MDKYGGMLTSETATNKNWESLKKRLPLAIQRFVRFTGAVWSCDITKDIDDLIPLFIAQAPVVIPFPVWSPVVTIVHLCDLPSDSLSNTPIDPTKPLNESVALKAFETFPGSVALLKFLDGTFIVVYPEDTDCSELMDTNPTQFGGLPVDVATDKMTPCMETDKIMLSTQPAEPVDLFVKSGAQDLSKGSQQIQLYPEVG